MILKFIRNLRLLILTKQYSNKFSKIKDHEFSKLNEVKTDYIKSFLDILKVEVNTKFINVIKRDIPDNNVLYICNHRSLLDIHILEKVISENIKIDKNKNNFWIAKKELSKMFFLGSFFREIKSNLFIDRTDPTNMFTLLKKIKKISKNNNSNVIIFPEGTRNKTNELLLEFKEGASLIARSSKMTIIPIFIKENTKEILNKNNNKNSVINVYIGESFKNSDNIESKYRDFMNLCI